MKPSKSWPNVYFGHPSIPLALQSTFPSEKAASSDPRRPYSGLACAVPSVTKTTIPVAEVGITALHGYIWADSGA